MNKNAKEAFHWIIHILRKNKVPFRISGGLAVNAYGSKRELADIDIDIPDIYIMRLLSFFRDYKYKGPNHYKDKEWDCYAISINYKD